MTAPRTPMPSEGRPIDDVIADLVAKRADDVRWEDGRAFGMIYDGGPEVREVAERAASLYLHENALNTNAFPSLGSIQSEVVRWTADLLSGPESVAGFLTSGGTESILCGVKAARERGRIERGIVAPELVIAESGHAAFHKAAHLFGLKVHKVPVRDDWTADVDAMARHVNDNTVLVSMERPARFRILRGLSTMVWVEPHTEGADRVDPYSTRCCCVGNGCP